MAVDLSAKKQRIIMKLMQLTDDLINDIASAAELASSVTEDGRITFTDADFDVDGLRHMDASTFNAALAQFDYTAPTTALAGWCLANASPDLEKIRP